MLNKLLFKLSDIYGTEDKFKFEFTSKDQIDQFISLGSEYFKYVYPDRFNEIDTFYSIWIQIFNELKYRHFKKKTVRTYEWHRTFNFSQHTFKLYSNFNIDSILKDSAILKKTTLREANFNFLINTSCDRVPFRKVDWNNPILVCNTLSESIVIDGNHRYQNAVSQNLDIPVLIISYPDLSKLHFINEYDFYVFKLGEEFNFVTRPFYTSMVNKSTQRTRIIFESSCPTDGYNRIIKY